MVFDKTTTNTTPQNRFLADKRNKDRVLKLLPRELQVSNIYTNQASKDADRTIVSTDKFLSLKYGAVIIVREDTELLTQP